MTRNLIHETETTKVYAVFNDSGERIGTDEESKQSVLEVSITERIAALEAELAALKTEIQV